MDNYSDLIHFLEDMSMSERGDAGSKSSGYLKQLLTFSMFFALTLSLVVFSKSESLANSLQSPQLSLSQAQSMVDTLSAVFNSDRDEQTFNEMWNAVVEESAKLSINEPVLPCTSTSAAPSVRWRCIGQNHITSGSRLQRVLQTYLLFYH